MAAVLSEALNSGRATVDKNIRWMYTCSTQSGEHYQYLCLNSDFESQVLVFIGDFNHPGISWKDNTEKGRHRQSRRMEPGSSQWCPVTALEQWAHTEAQEAPSEQQGTLPLCQAHMSTGRHCPERQWGLQCWRCLNF